MSPIRHPDDRNVDEMYGEKAQRGAQFWVDAGELLGYRLCDGSLQRMPPEPQVDSEHVFVEVFRGGDHLLWYSKTMKTISDLIDKVRNVFGEAPHEIMMLTLMGDENSTALPRETQLQNLMRLRVMYSPLPPLSTATQLETLEDELSNATWQMWCAERALLEWQLNPRRPTDVFMYLHCRVNDLRRDVEGLAEQLRTVRGQLP
jgi:hypothetical protein